MRFIVRNKSASEAKLCRVYIFQLMKKKKLSETRKDNAMSLPIILSRHEIEEKIEKEDRKKETRTVRGRN